MSDWWIAFSAFGWGFLAGMIITWIIAAIKIKSLQLDVLQLQAVSLLTDEIVSEIELKYGSDAVVEIINMAKTKTLNQVVGSKI